MNNRWKPQGLLLIACVGASLGASAQNEEDALRYSQSLPGGTARGWAMGSAMGAVGADPAAATLNPAGFGLYNTSELSLTTGLEVNTADTWHYGTNASASDVRFHLNNVALILSFPSKQGGDLRGGTFGFSYDRQASYHWDEQAVGHGVNSTILQRFVNEAEGTAPSDLPNNFPFSSSLAWDAYGIDPLDTISNSYVSAIPYGTSTVEQSHHIASSGRLSNTSFFYANNYKDKLYFGLSVGLIGARYERHTTHTETSNDLSLAIRDLTYKEDLLTTGNGIDVKVGVIGRVTNSLRVGLAYHSPMWMSMSDAYNYGLTTNFRNVPGTPPQDHYSIISPYGTFDYRVTTPWRLVASAMYQVGKHGLVSVDYCYTDFTSQRLKAADGTSDTYDFSMENNVISNNFVSTNSFRAGTEWRSGNWYFRGGWGIWPDAYSEKDRRHGTSYKRYTGGIGYRVAHMSIDFAMVYGTRDINYYQYDADLIEATNEKQTDVRGMLTVAFRP